jgi:hypothetical protein
MPFCPDRVKGGAELYLATYRPNEKMKQWNDCEEWCDQTKDFFAEREIRVEIVCVLLPSILTPWRYFDCFAITTQTILLT